VASLALERYCRGTASLVHFFWPGGDIVAERDRRLKTKGREMGTGKRNGGSVALFGSNICDVPFPDFLAAH